ncbi:hypothetical protein [Chthonobacter rhizosphaerae]|uniref:hypothetical protein n=1 Tax=Chthonobacter rhizosphaerae TaxID=2735553 RepID=UPI0015EF9B73|nr:hypothetical protein [Chthonobacter rhizosphaerae]
MHLVEILLPTADNEGNPFPRSHFTALRQELVDRFGGVTVFARSPAEGFWDGGDSVDRDEIVIFEVMCEDLDEAWWRERRRNLERLFRQDAIVIRAQSVRRL